MIELAHVKSQPLSTLVCDHLICRSCGIIDRDYGRMKKGYICTTCQSESECGRMVFPITISVLVDLAQESYHSHYRESIDSGPHGRDVSVLIYFCTLREALLNALLINHLRSIKTPASIIKQLLDDNKLASQKFSKLFVSIFEMSWKEAVDDVSSSGNFDYRPVSTLMKDAAITRNEFLHEGAAWRISPELGRECMNSMGDLVSLFVELHNKFTHPIIRASGV
jgi:hypothetical protein